MPAKTGKDLTKEPPRSPHVEVGGFKVLGRTIDKCRALLWGRIGGYHFDDFLDGRLFKWKQISDTDFKAFVAEGHTDDEIADWVRSSGVTRDKGETKAWNREVAEDNYSENPAKKQWLEGENERLGLDEDGTLFDMLDADDRASFPARDT